MANKADHLKRRTEEQILIRRVTDVQASWTERDRSAASLSRQTRVSTTRAAG